jgi:hypothetical protein
MVLQKLLDGSCACVCARERERWDTWTVECKVKSKRTPNEARASRTLCAARREADSSDGWEQRKELWNVIALLIRGVDCAVETAVALTAVQDVPNHKASIYEGVALIFVPQGGQIGRQVRSNVR